MHCVKCFDMYKRAEHQTIKSRLEEDRMFIQVVMGPRQVGKSTVVKQVLDDLTIPYQLYSADNVPATNTADSTPNTKNTTQPCLIPTY